jgi:putative hemin transport protein
MNSLPIDRLRSTWEHLVCRDGLRPREAAERLQVAEAELVASRCGMDVIRLKPEWPVLFGHVRALGPAIAVTRNSGAAMVKASAYALPQFASGLGQVVGAVDLRLFTANWGDAFALTSDQGQRARRSICIFDRSGNAVHKIMLHPESCTTAFDTLVWNRNYSGRCVA